MATKEHSYPTGDECPIAKMPAEILLAICDHLDSSDMVIARKAWHPFEQTMARLILLRNLRCSTTGKGPDEAEIGIDVSVQGVMKLEFDFISKAAFDNSNDDVYFHHWLPLPLTEKHWERIKRLGLLRQSLESIRATTDASRSITRTDHILASTGHLVNDLLTLINVAEIKLLDCATEKTVNGYFALFHLIICMMLDDDSILTTFQSRIQPFRDGHTSKTAVPSLSYLNAARLFVDVCSLGNSEKDTMEQELLTMKIIEEGFVRNVGSMLTNVFWWSTSKPSLAYLEPSSVSEYRLTHTFRATKISYLLLMIRQVMRRTVLQHYGGKTLADIRGDLFSRCGAPPQGTTAKLAEEIRAIKEVNEFSGFFKAMGFSNVPTKEHLTTLLRDSIRRSVELGYSRNALTQSEALYLRKQDEPDVEVAEGVIPKEPVRESISFRPGEVSFYPK